MVPACYRVSFGLSQVSFVDIYGSFVSDIARDLQREHTGALLARRALARDIRRAGLRLDGGREEEAHGFLGILDRAHVRAVEGHVALAIVVALDLEQLALQLPDCLPSRGFQRAT